MRLVILGMNYAPEVTGIAPYTAGLAERFAGQGHAVTVATTFPHYPVWRVAPPYAGRRFVVERRNGVRVIRTPVLLPAPGSAGRRVLYDSSLAAGAILSTLPLRRPDAILAVSPPIQVGLTAALLARRWRAPLALLVKDLPLEAAVAVGLLGAGRALRVGRRLERLVYRLADRIIVISDGFRASVLAQGVPPAKLTTIPDWADTAAIFPAPPDPALRRRLGATPGDFLLLHTGNQGQKQGLAASVRAAALTPPVARLRLTLVGDGSDHAALAVLVADRPNVALLPLQPAELFPRLLAAADALLLCQRAAVLDSVAPSKLLAYMAAGRPVLAAVHPASAAATVVRAAGCGLLLPPEDPPALAAAIARLAAAPALRAALGAAGRRYVEQHYARDRILARYDAFFRDLISEAARE